MPDHSSDATRAGHVDAAPTAEVDAAGAAPTPESAYARTGPRARRADWRLGGRTVRRWREGLLAIALLSFGAGILASAAVQSLWQSPLATPAATALRWVGMVVPVVCALARSRPAGLLRFRPLDLLYAVTLGVMLRLAQGWIEVASGGRATFPSYPLIDGRLSPWWWLTDGLAVAVGAPFVEEFFFRGVVLVALYTVLRRPAGRMAAAVAAVLASTGLFVLAHVLLASEGADQFVATALLGVTCGTLVALTGRIWGAVLVHMVYNATYVALALAAAL